MKSAKFAMFLVFTNVVLLAVVFWEGHLLREVSQKQLQQPDFQTADPRLSSSSQPKNRVGTKRENFSDEVAPAFPAATNNPAWRSIESQDYRTYVKNLRAIGCPEQTVRDIVSADVVQAFAAKRNEMMAERYRDFKYWKTDAEEAAARAELERQRRELDAQVSDVLRELIGEDAGTPSMANEWKKAELNQQLNFLDQNKRDKTVAALTRYAEIDAQVHGLSDWNHTPETIEERRRVLTQYENKQRELWELLTAEEYERVDMTVSWTADNLRHAMENFHPTEEEFRAIFREWRAHDENLAKLRVNGESDPGNDQVFAKIQQFLGEERFALYKSTWWQ
jgi:hypothetical protein